MTNLPASETGDDLSSLLPASVRIREFGDRKFYIVGTAHVSKKSVDEVRQAIDLLRPDSVCVELDQARYQNLMDEDRWKKTNIAEVIRKGKAMLLLSSLIMTSFQRRIGRKLGIMPGAELRQAVESAREVGASVELIDRDIQITLKRAWASFGFVERLKVAGQLVASLLVSEEIDEKTIEELKQGEKLTDVLELLAREFPSMKETLIDERDVYLAENLRNSSGRNVVAVVGAGHVPGILKALNQENDLSPLEAVPPPSVVTRLLKWLIPLLIVGVIVAGFITGNTRESMGSVYIWFLVNGIFSALGAALALGHPLSVLTAFLAAPLTSLNPFVAAGWVSGIVQALLKRPTVSDLQSLPEAITSVKGFWLNPVSRILLVVVFSNLGSVLGTLVAGSWIFGRFLG